MISGRSQKEGYQPKWISLLTQLNISGRIVKRGSDEMGRYTWIQLNGKNNKKVIIITAYRVCKAGNSIGTHTAHMQQVKHLLQKGMVTPNARKEMIKDLGEMIKEHLSEGRGVILMLYSNEEWEKKSQGDMSEFLLATQLKGILKARR